MPFMRKYNILLVTGTTAIRIPIIKRAVVDFAVGADWTPVAGDVKVFVDGAAVANITNLPTAIASGNTAQWEFILTAAELSCKQILVMIADAATKAVEDQAFIVETYGHASAMYAADLSLANLPANVTQLLGTAWLAPGVAGTPDVNAKLLGAAPVTATTSVTIPAASTLATTTGAVGSVTGAVGSVTVVSDKTGYSLTQAFPTNFAALSISAGGLVDILQTAADKVWGSAARTLTNFGTLVADTATAVWGAVARTLTSFGTLVADVKAAILSDTTAFAGASIATIKANTDNLPSAVKKNTARVIPFKMVLASDHVAAGTGLTITAQRSLDGAAFAGCAGAVTEVGSGWYTLSAAAGDLNGDSIALKFTAATADQRDIAILTEP